MSPKPQLVWGSWWGNEWAFYHRGIVTLALFPLRDKHLLCCQMRSGCQFKEYILSFVGIHVFKVEMLSEMFSFFFPKPSESCSVVKARGVPSSSPLEEVFLSFFSHPTEGHSQCFGSFATQNIFLSLSRPSLSPPPHWCVSRRTQGQCLTEPWMLFSCHTFPKRLAAAPIVATEGGLLSWSFRPPAVALVSDGFIVRECGPNNGQRHDVMLLMWAKSLCRYVVGFRCVEHIRKDISDLPFGLQIGQQIFFFLPRIQNFNNCCFY